jgi:L-cysteine:1D-myo-inositol 2-amino-2-deoxy-alpha-D-glucopyranoside ligase
VDAWSAAALTGTYDDKAAPALVAQAVDALLGVRL